MIELPVPTGRRADAGSGALRAIGSKLGGEDPDLPAEIPESVGI